MSEILTLLLTHQSADRVGRMLRFWEAQQKGNPILLAYGGPEHEFAAIQFPQKILIDSARLKTRDHQRQKQSYQAIFNAAAAWLPQSSCQYVHFVEFDQIPLVGDWSTRCEQFLNENSCDVAGHYLARIDETSNPHYLYHAADENFSRYLEKISVRSDPKVVFTMFGSGSFWTRDAFEVVGRLEEEVPIYLEIFLPTVVHHLGFRIKDFGAQNKWIKNLGDLSPALTQARTEGAWSIHPVKNYWDAEIPG